jgi:hypothetical protein
MPYKYYLKIVFVPENLFKWYDIHLSTSRFIALILLQIWGEIYSAFFMPISFAHFAMRILKPG